MSLQTANPVESLNEEDRMVYNALTLALEAHDGQVDLGGVPIIEHLRRVMAQMDTKEEMTVALLHDIVEDTTVTLDDLHSMGFPDNVVKAVDFMTHVGDIDYFEYIERVKLNDLAVKVKLADIRDNMDVGRLSRIPEHQVPSMTKRYVKAYRMLHGRA